MEKNLLQTALEEEKRRGRVLDLIDTNFHRNGFMFPAEILDRSCRTYFSSRMYDPDPKGTMAAREAISRYYEESGVPARPDDIVITASASESYDLLFSTLTSPGDNILLPSPGYPLFEFLAEKSRLETRFYALDADRGWSVDLESVRRLVTYETKFLVLISPNNPTGAVIPGTDLKEILALCSRYGVMLITDEVFSDFLYASGSLPRPAAFDPTVPVFTINGISKIFACPDLKLSWILVTAPAGKTGMLTETLETANDVFLSASSLTQHILPDLFTYGAAFRASMLDEMKKRREILLSSFGGSEAISFVPPAGGIHCILTLRSPGRSGDDESCALDLLRRHRVYVHPGYFYGIEGGVSFVVSFLKRPEELIEGLAGLRRFAEERGTA